MLSERVGSSQIINYSLQPKATEIPTEPSFALHNGRITVGGCFPELVCLLDRLVLPLVCGRGKLTFCQCSFLLIWGCSNPFNPFLYDSNLASFLATQPIFGTFQRLHVC